MTTGTNKILLQATVRTHLVLKPLSKLIKSKGANTNFQSIRAKEMEDLHKTISCTQQSDKVLCL